MMILKLSNEIICDDSKPTALLQMRRALRKPTLKETEIKAIEDAKFIDSICQIIHEILKSDSKN